MLLQRGGCFWPSMKRAVFIERDAILNEVRTGPKQQITPITLEEFKVVKAAAESLKKLKAVGLLTAAGLAAAPTDNTYAPRPAIADLPAYMAKALKENPQAWSFFEGLGANLPPSLCRLDSFGQTRGNEGKTPSRSHQSAGGW